MGKILRINLSSRKVQEESLKEDFLKVFVGSIGIGGKILYDEVPPWAGAFDSANRLIFSTGPVTGSITQTAGRHTVLTKSPLTGCFGDASAGGFWGAELKFAGYDAIVFSGRAEKPVWIWINDNHVEIKDASPYWGKDARECDRALVKDLGDKRVQVCCIGQAGENWVRYSAVMHDDAGRAAARCGVGAVMGFMNLKAIAVRGSKKVPVKDEEELSKLMREIMLHYKNSDFVRRFHRGGTPSSYATVMLIGDSPTYNFAGEEFGEFDESRIKKLAWPGGYELILEKTNTCYVCTIACRRVSKQGEGKYKLIEGSVEGVEYENMSMLGSNCGIDDIYAVNLMNDLCNRYGLDTISTGSVMAFAMECYERGIIDKKDTDGLDLRFGNADAAIELIHKIARREGFGNLLAEGTRRASRIIGKGAEKYAMQVKGLEIPAHDPRAFQGGGPHYACCPEGADHMEGLSLGIEAFGLTFKELGIQGSYNRFDTYGKAELAKKMEDWWNFVNSMGWCLFSAFRYGDVTRFVMAYNSVTGLNIDLKEALKIGERLYNLKRAFNYKHSVRREEDTLPERLLKEPNKRAENSVVKLEITLPQYYKIRGWDENTGAPTKEKLVELGLEEIAKDLFK